MSNTLPLPEQPKLFGGLRPARIDPTRYPALDQLQAHSQRDGPALIDRVYTEAQSLYKELQATRAELELVMGKPAAPYGAKLREAPVVTTIMSMGKSPRKPATSINLAESLL